MPTYLSLSWRPNIQLYQHFYAQLATTTNLYLVKTCVAPAIRSKLKLKTKDSRTRQTFVTNVGKTRGNNLVVSTVKWKRTIQTTPVLT